MNHQNTTARRRVFRSLIDLHLTDKEIARFHSKVTKGPPDECWPWARTPDKDGYGSFPIWRDGKEIRLRAHRVAFFLHRKIDPESQLVCHECDLTICCNPACLFIGTDSDNAQDKARKGRQTHPIGERCGMAKLTSEHIAEIKRIRSETGATCHHLGRQFDVSEEQVRRIIKGMRWAHLSNKETTNANHN